MLALLLLNTWLCKDIARWIWAHGQLRLACHGVTMICWMSNHSATTSHHGLRITSSKELEVAGYLQLDQCIPATSPKVDFDLLILTCPFGCWPDSSVHLCSLSCSGTLHDMFGCRHLVCCDLPLCIFSSICNNCCCVSLALLSLRLIVNQCWWRFPYHAFFACQVTCQRCDACFEGR